MSLKVFGNLHGLSPSQVRSLEKLYRRSITTGQLVTNELAREVYQCASDLGRRVGLLINREGDIENVIVGKREILYLPDLGRQRIAPGRLRGLRLIFSDLSKSQEKVTIPNDIIADLEKLRLDAVCAVKVISNQVRISHAWNIPFEANKGQCHETVINESISKNSHEFENWVAELEKGIEKSVITSRKKDETLAIIVGIYPKGFQDAQEETEELNELARTAGVRVVDVVVQYRDPDPKTYIGRGKLEEIVLRAVQHDANMLIFGSELSPAQWRSITNATDLKVLDRSMLILDIFAQHAKTSDGKLQVELAQIKYNLPKLVEKDAGLSRLTGGIGGRGPGETKLELGRRRYRDRINDLEKQIDALSAQRHLRSKKREGIPIPMIALVGYTNAGKSALFNALTRASVLVENKLFATLDPSQKRLFLEHTENAADFHRSQAVLTDTVGFIRELPEELVNAFRATLEQIAQAQLLLHVVDCSGRNVNGRFQAVGKQLEEFGLGAIQRITVFNKCDLITSDNMELLRVEHPDAIVVSAVKKIGLKDLMDKIKLSLRGQQVSEPVFSSEESDHH
jgi:GTP-binding protein HflX